MADSFVALKSLVGKRAQQTLDADIQANESAFTPNSGPAMPAEAPAPSWGSAFTVGATAAVKAMPGIGPLAGAVLDNPKQAAADALTAIGVPLGSGPAAAVQGTVARAGSPGASTVFDDVPVVGGVVRGAGGLGMTLGEGVRGGEQYIKQTGDWNPLHVIPHQIGAMAAPFEQQLTAAFPEEQFGKYGARMLKEAARTATNPGMLQMALKTPLAFAKVLFGSELGAETAIHTAEYLGADDELTQLAGATGGLVGGFGATLIGRGQPSPGKALARREDVAPQSTEPVRRVAAVQPNNDGTFTVRSFEQARTVPGEAPAPRRWRDVGTYRSEPEARAYADMINSAHTGRNAPDFARPLVTELPPNWHETHPEIFRRVVATEIAGPPPDEGLDLSKLHPILLGGQTTIGDQRSGLLNLGKAIQDATKGKALADPSVFGRFVEDFRRLRRAVGASGVKPNAEAFENGIRSIATRYIVATTRGVPANEDPEDLENAIRAEANRRKRDISPEEFADTPENAEYGIGAPASKAEALPVVEGTEAGPIAPPAAAPAPQPVRRGRAAPEPAPIIDGSEEPVPSFGPLAQPIEAPPPRSAQPVESSAPAAAYNPDAGEQPVQAFGKDYLVTGDPSTKDGLTVRRVAAEGKPLDVRYGTPEYAAVRREVAKLVTEPSPLAEVEGQEAHRTTPSEGHVAFIGPYEYVRRPDGTLYRGPVANPIGTDGYRQGLRFEAQPHAAEQALKLAREAFAEPPAEAPSTPGQRRREVQLPDRRDDPERFAQAVRDAGRATFWLQPNGSGLTWQEDKIGADFSTAIEEAAYALANDERLDHVYVWESDDLDPEWYKNPLSPDPVDRVDREHPAYAAYVEKNGESLGVRRPTTPLPDTPPPGPFERPGDREPPAVATLKNPLAVDDLPETPPHPIPAEEPTDVATVPDEPEPGPVAGVQPGAGDEGVAPGGEPGPLPDVAGGPDAAGLGPDGPVGPADVVPVEPPPDGGAVEPAGAGAVVQPGPGPVDPTSALAARRIADAIAARSSRFFAPYEDRVGGGGAPHPRLIVETNLLAKAPYPPLSVGPGPSVQSAWQQGLVSNEQVDGIVAVKQARQNGHGYVVADDVGVGKTRILAGVLMDLIDEGAANRVLWTTWGPQNIHDLIGASKPSDFRTMFPNRPDVLFVDVSLVFEPNGRVKPGQQSVAERLRDPRVKTVVYLLHRQTFAPYVRGGFLGSLSLDHWIADEAHAFKSLSKVQGEAWSNLHLDLLHRGKRVTYATATPATDAADFRYMYDLGEWGPDKTDFQAFVGRVNGYLSDAEALEAMERGRTFGQRGRPITIKRSQGKGSQLQNSAYTMTLPLAATQQLTAEMKRKGKYHARDLWRSGVEFAIRKVDALPEGTDPATAAMVQQEMAAKVADYDQFVLFAGEVQRAWDKYKRFSDLPNKGYGVFGQLQGAVRRKLVDLRLEAAIREAEAAVARGEKAIIYSDYVKVPKPTEDGSIGGNLGAAIKMIPTEYVDKRTGELVPLPEARALKKRLEQEGARYLGDLRAPHQMLKERLAQHGVSLIIGGVDGKVRAEDAAKFQQGVHKIAVVSDAGSTGINLHDEFNTGRVNVVLASMPWSGERFKQLLGRADRTGQQTSPAFLFLHMGQAGEIKFISSAANRLNGLGATSKGQAGSASYEDLAGFEVDGHVGTEAMRRLWKKVPEEDRALFFKDDFQASVGSDLSPSAQVKDLLDALELLPSEKANRYAADFFAIMNEVRDADRVANAHLYQEDRLRGRIVKETPIGQDLTLYEVRPVAGPRYGIVSGLIMLPPAGSPPRVRALRGAISGVDGPAAPPLAWVTFEGEDGQSIVGARAYAHSFARLGARFGVEITPAPRTWQEVLFDATQDDEGVPLVSPSGSTLTLRQRNLRHLGRQGFVLEGTPVRTERDALVAAGAAWDPNRVVMEVPLHEALSVLTQYPPIGGLVDEAGNPVVPTGAAPPVEPATPEEADAAIAGLAPAAPPAPPVAPPDAGLSPAPPLPPSPPPAAPPGAPPSAPAGGGMGGAMPAPAAPPPPMPPPPMPPGPGGTGAAPPPPGGPGGPPPGAPPSPPPGSPPGAPPPPPPGATPQPNPWVDDLPEKAGNILLKKYPVAVARVIWAWSIEHKAEFDNFVRGTIPLAEIRRMASELIADTQTNPKHAAREWMPGDIKEAAHVVAMRWHLNDLADKIANLGARVRAGDNSTAVLAELAALNEELYYAQRAVHGYTAEAGRLLGSFRIGFSDALRQAGMGDAEALKKLLDKLGGRVKMEDLLAVLNDAELTSPDRAVRARALFRAARLLHRASWGDWLEFVFMNSILSNPATATVNMVSNSVQAGITPLEKLLAAGVDVPLHAMGRRPRSRFFGEAWESVKGMGNAGLPEGSNIAAGAKDGLRAFLSYLRNGYDDLQVTTMEFRPPPIPGVAGDVVGMPMRFLEATDRLWTAIVFGAELRSLAYRKAASEGLRGDALIIRQREILANAADEGILDQAGKMSQYRLFRQDAGGFMRLLMRARDWEVLGDVEVAGRAIGVHPLRFLFPFLRTPLNIWKYGLERSPLGVLNPELVRNMVTGDPAAPDNVARVLLGTGIALGLAAYVADGQLTGPPPTNAADRDKFYREGKIPYAAKIGNTWVSYQRLEPLNTPLAQVAAFTQDLQSGRAVDYETFSQALISLVQNMTQQNFLTGLADMLDAITDPQRSASKLFTRIGTGLLTPAALRAAAQTPQLGGTDAVKDPSGFGQHLMANVPFLQENVPDRTDAFGRTIRREAPAWDPYKYATATHDPVERELGRLSVAVGIAGRKINGVQLRDTEVRALQRDAGQRVHANLTRLIQSPLYQARNDENKERLIRVAIRRGRSDAAKDLVRRVGPGEWRQRVEAAKSAAPPGR